MPGVQNKSIFRRFESLIDPFKDAPDITPPGRVLRFYAYYLLQVWPIFAVLLVVGLAGALVEVALFSFLADIVDLARDTPPAEFFQRHAGLLLWMAVVVMVLRPLAIAAHDLLTHQTIAPSLTTLVRWQNHRYVLGQGLAFFHNDFAGRVANRVMQAGRAARFRRAVGGRAVARHPVRGQRAVPVRRGRLAAGDPAGAVDRRLLLHAGLFRAAHAGARRDRVGSALQAHGPHRRRLYQHRHAQALRPCPAGRELRTPGAGRTDGKQQLSTRVITAMDVSINTLNGVLIVGTAGLALWLWSQDSITLARSRWRWGW